MRLSELEVCQQLAADRPTDHRPFPLYRSIFPSPEPNPGLSHYQGLLNSGGSLPDLTNLHFPSPLSTPLDPDDGSGGYANLSGGSSTGNLPAAMMHLGIGNSQGVCDPQFAGTDLTQFKTLGVQEYSYS